MVHQCCELVHNDYGVSFHNCLRKGKIERDGRWYCGQHDPVAVAAKNKARTAAWDAKWKAERAAIVAQQNAAFRQEAEAKAYRELIEAMRSMARSHPNAYVVEACCSLVRQFTAQVERESKP